MVWLTGFLEWNPRLDAVRLAVAPLAIYLATGVPEEFLFRGLIQNTLERAIGRAALPIASIIFGLAHLPDVRYVLLTESQVSPANPGELRAAQSGFHSA